MEQYQREFIEFMVRSGVLTFGDFVTKSGRRTPFFINTGNYDTGDKMDRLGQYYAASIRARMGDQFDCLFGPAYKGIPLAVTTAIALSRVHGQNVPYSFNRKEAKDHGEGGSLVGYKIKSGDRVLIVEDVTTAGTSVRETFEIMKAIGDVKIVGLVVSADRQERGKGEKSALAELREEFGIETFAIVTLDNIVAHLHNREVDGQLVLNDQIHAAILEYRKQYGAK